MLAYLLFLFLMSTLIESTPSGGCGVAIPALPNPGHHHKFKIQVDDPYQGLVNRHYWLHLPTHYPHLNNRATPLVVDFHGFTGDGSSQQYQGGLNDVANEDPEGFIVVHGDGADEHEPHLRTGWKSWNCSSTDGPLGPPCALPRENWGAIHCMDSCPTCDPENSCDYSSCYDDIAFTRAVIDHIAAAYCVDMDSIHLSGVSNGGMFSYYAASRLNDVIASIAPVASSPFMGFGDIPDTPVSLIDFHGSRDDTIPYDLSSHFTAGPGPHDSVSSTDGYYYQQKPATLLDWATKMECQLNPVEYPTTMDGVNKFHCVLWTGCKGGAEIVHCTGHWAHDYPFYHQPDSYVDGTRILWEFMKNHRRQ